MTSPVKFWDKIAEGYAKKPVADEAVYQTKLETTRQYLRPDMDVLEIGCGTGSTALTHAPYVRHIRATDISAQMIRIAQDKATEQGVSNVTFECTSIDDLQAEDRSFDAILALSILHLVPNVEEVLARMARLLKPGGVLVSSTACISDMAFWLPPILSVGRWLGFFPYVNAFSQKQLEQKLTDAGFTLGHVWLPGKGKAVFIVAQKPA